MKTSTPKCRRVLAFYPSKRGFGFAVMEGPEELIDWGTKEVRQEKNMRYVRHITILIEKYCPDLVVIEGYDKESQRCARIKGFLDGIAMLALSKKVKLKRISRLVLRRRFSQDAAFSKRQIAFGSASNFLN